MKLKALLVSTVLVTAGCSTQPQQTNQYTPELLPAPSDTLHITNALTYLAKDGDVSSQMLLSKIYYHGEGVNQDKELASLWLNEAAINGHPVAQFRLGVMHYTGDGIPKSDTEAVRWLEQSALQGNKKAQNYLAYAYYESAQMKDDFQAFRWAKEAAQKGEVDSQLLLGILYRNAEGTPQNLKQSVFWLRKAALQGDTDAQQLLGRMFYEGQGVLKSDISAYVWTTIANHNGNKDNLLKGLVVNMTPEEIESGKRLAQQCLMSHYTACR